MTRIALLLSVLLAGCTPVVAACGLILIINGTPVCVDVDAGFAPSDTFCYCDHCGGIALDVGGRSGPHNFKNSSSHGPCPAIGGPCTPTGFRVGGPDSPPDGGYPSDLALPVPPDLGESVLASPDMAKSCRSGIAAVEACRTVKDRAEQKTCINRVTAGDDALSYLAICVTERCPKGTRLVDACSVDACSQVCCDALRGCP